MYILAKDSSKRLKILLKRVLKSALSIALFSLLLSAFQIASAQNGKGAVISMDAPKSAQAGSSMTYTITVSANASPGPGTLTDVLPPSVSFISCTASGGGVCGGTGNIRTVSFPSLGVDSETVAFVVAVKCSAQDTISNTATLRIPGSTNSATTTTAVFGAATMSCPPDITVPTSPGQAAAVVNYPEPTFSADCPGMTIISSPPSGSAFPIGTTTVTSTALDSGAFVAQCSFNVTVVDREPPRIVCPGDISAVAPPGQSSAVVRYNIPVTDNVPGVSVFITPPSGSTFPIGSTTVNVVALDASGNRSACSFNVVVTDKELPKIVCPENIVINTPRGQASAVVNYPPPKVTDNAAGLNVTMNPPSGSSFPIGVTNVNVTATDASGNASTCSFTITVLDKEPPTIACPDDVGAMAEPGKCTAVVNYPNPQATDNAPGVRVEFSPSAGTPFPVGVNKVQVTAIDASGNKSNCSFNVVVMGFPRAQLTIPDGRTSLDFNPVTASRRPKINPSSQPFLVENVGCAPLNVVFSSILRTGSLVDGVTITNPNDIGLFGLRVLSNDGTETAINTGETVVIGRGGTRDFRVVFNPLIPEVAGRIQGLSASQVIPDRISSELILTHNSGDPFRVPISGRVNTRAFFINADNPSRKPTISFTRSGDRFTVVFGLYDSNLDVNRAQFQFFDAAGTSVGQTIEVDLANPIRNAGLIRGQSFIVEQPFSGANDNPAIVSVRVVVFDGEGSAAGKASSMVSADAKLFAGEPMKRLIVPEINLNHLFSR